MIVKPGDDSDVISRSETYHTRVRDGKEQLMLAIIERDVQRDGVR
jgi:hypothetical protein